MSLLSVLFVLFEPGLHFVQCADCWYGNAWYYNQYVFDYVRPVVGSDDLPALANEG
jgi:hypothetical protein